MPSLAAVTRPRVLEWPMLESRGVQAVRVAVRLEGTPIRGNQVGHGMPAKPVAVKPESAIERVLDAVAPVHKLRPPQRTLPFPAQYGTFY